MNSLYQRMRSGLLALACLAAPLMPATAEPLYQQQYEAAQPDEKALDKARKQIREHKEIKIKDDIGIPPFHKRGQQRTLAKEPLCSLCHLPLPHQKNERSRSFMNMHSRYIACETCHFRPDKVTFDYRWLAYDGPRVGQLVPPRERPSAIGEAKGGDEKQARKAPLAPYEGARITPFLDDAWVLLFKDSEFARQIDQTWQDADEEQRARLKARLHSPLQEQGPACKACHGRDETLLDLGALGATEQQIQAMQRNAVVRFFERYKKDDERIRISNILK